MAYKIKCKYCKDTGKMQLFRTIVDCDECGPEEKRKNLIWIQRLCRYKDIEFVGIIDRSKHIRGIIK